MIKVSGHADLVRDPQTGAIINNNRSEYEAYIARKTAMESRERDFQRQAEELTNIKLEMESMQNMITQLMNSK